MSITLSLFSDVFYETSNYVKSIENGEPVSAEVVNTSIAGKLKSVEGKRLEIIDSLVTPEVPASLNKEVVEEAQFAVVAYIDEKFSFLNWREASEWRKQLLQKQFFDTVFAGIEYFDRLKKILNGSSEGERDLLEVYYITLKLGYLGRYFDDYNQIEEVRESVKTRLARLDEREKQSDYNFRPVFSPKPLNVNFFGTLKRFLVNMSFPISIGSSIYIGVNYYAEMRKVAEILFNSL